MKGSLQVLLVVVVVAAALCSRLADATCLNSLDCKEGFFCNQKEKLCVAHAGESDCRSEGCERGHVCDQEMGRCVYKAQLRDGGCNAENPCPESYHECHNGLCVRVPIPILTAVLRTTCAYTMKSQHKIQKKHNKKIRKLLQKLKDENRRCHSKA